MPLIKCYTIAYLIDYVCYKNSKISVFVSEWVHKNTFMMFSLISSNKDTFKQVAITAAWSSNLGMLVLLFAGAKRDFDKTKLHFTVSCFLQWKKATVPNAEFEYV